MKVVSDSPAPRCLSSCFWVRQVQGGRVLQKVVGECLACAPILVKTLLGAISA